MTVKSFLPLSIFGFCILVACSAHQATPATSLQTTPDLPIQQPSRTLYPFTPVPFESLIPYATPEDGRPGCTYFATQVLPENVTPPIPTAQPQGSERRKSLYYLVGQKPVGRYMVRLWEHACKGLKIVTISAKDEILAQVEASYLAVRHAGQDITGEGHADVVVQVWDPASMVHVSTQVYDLGPGLTKVLDSPVVSSDPNYEVPCPWAGVFSDLEGDGSAEFLTCDDAPRWGYYNESCINPYAEHRQLEVMAVLEYEPGRGYAPASPRFASVYADTIAHHTRQAEEQAAQKLAGEAGYSKDALVALTFNYLYSGQPAEAWAELERLHIGPDTVLLWSEILQIASESPFYVPGGNLPDVPVPDYYTLQLRFGCEPYQNYPTTPEAGQATCEPVEWLADRFARGISWPISILVKGQEPCDPHVSLRSLDWLREQLRRASVIERGEYLQVSSLDCAGTCRLEVRDIENDITLGFIELDASGGFPGEVVRVDVEGRESTRWHLRGDLTWEAVVP